MAGWLVWQRVDSKEDSMVATMALMTVAKTAVMTESWSVDSMVKR